MRIYKNSAYENRGFSWRPPVDPWGQFDPDYKDDCDGYDSYYDEKDYPRCPWAPYPPCRPWPCPPKCSPYRKYRPEDRKYPCPQLVPYPYPVPYPCPYIKPDPKPDPKCDPKPDPKPDPKCDPGCDKRDEEAFGYFASSTSQGAFPGGAIAFNFSGENNRNVSIILPGGTQVRIQQQGLYRVVYSATTIAAANAALQLLLNGNVVPSSPITIQEGVNSNEIFLRLNRNDTLSLNLTGPVTLADGKNASLLVQRVA